MKMYNNNVKYATHTIATTIFTSSQLAKHQNEIFATKETVKSSSLFGRLTGAPVAQKPMDSHVGRASKDAGRKYANLYAYPGARFLILSDCPVYPLATGGRPMGVVPLSLFPSPKSHYHM